MEAVPNSVKTHLKSLGFGDDSEVFYQQTPKELQSRSIERILGTEDENGVLCVRTGIHTGRSPKDRFIVEDSITKDKVHWGAINKPFAAADFDALFKKVIHFFKGREIFVRDDYACAEKKYRISIRTICEYPWSTLFAYNMFINPEPGDEVQGEPDWLIVDAPEFEAVPAVDKTLSPNFAIINFTKRIIMVGGTGYTGEMKKGIFSVLNFTLPTQHKALPMHCSANVGEKGDTALFFGLSGTGKTTLSADPHRYLIGDDEHGWSEDGLVFNFEGGCYAKVINLKKEHEPDIYNAIKPGALLENVVFEPDTKRVDFTNASVTQNTRVSYPIDFIKKIKKPSVGKYPSNVFFLTCDAFGVLPPVSRLDENQAAYHFISGYTAKIAGTEEGIVEPLPSFSACFGAPFMPLHPTVYGDMLIEKIQKTKAKVWMINTGWIGGGYGAGHRIDLASTRAIIHAILDGHLDNVEYDKHRFFSLNYPKTCPNVDDKLLSPRESWKYREEYEHAARTLAVRFHENFKKYASSASKDIINGSPEYGRA